MLRDKERGRERERPGKDQCIYAPSDRQLSHLVHVLGDKEDIDAAEAELRDEDERVDQRRRKPA